MTGDEQAPRVPVTVLTGFLGAGKTTLAGDILRDPRFADTAVIVNEFGDVALDHELVEAADETVVETTAGCLCCTVQGDVRRTILELVRRARAGEIRRFSRIVVETTGLADPTPVLHTFIADEALQPVVALNGVVTLLDAVNGLSSLDRYEEARRQIACADLVVLTKTDALPPSASDALIGALRDRVRGLNPSARLIDRAVDGLTGADLFSVAAYDPSGKPPDVLDWLRFEATDRAARKHHDHDHHHHDHNRHGESVRAHCIAFDAPLQARGFWFALEMLQAYRGDRLLRMKGLVALDDAPDEPVVVHAVQHVVGQPRRLPAWPSADRRSRLVVIADGVPEKDIRGVFALFETAAPRDRRSPAA